MLDWLTDFGEWFLKKVSQAWKNEKMDKQKLVALKYLLSRVEELKAEWRCGDYIESINTLQLIIAEHKKGN